MRDRTRVVWGVEEDAEVVQSVLRSPVWRRFKAPSEVSRPELERVIANGLRELRKNPEWGEVQTGRVALVRVKDTNVVKLMLMVDVYDLGDAQ